jgi:hypothetical protein
MYPQHIFHILRRLEELGLSCVDKYDGCGKSAFSITKWSADV